MWNDRIIYIDGVAFEFEHAQFFANSLLVHIMLQQKVRKNVNRFYF